MVRIFRAIPADRLRLLVFDLDGTLVDSRQDLVNAVNAALKHFGLPDQPGDQIASFIGDGASKLVERALAAAGANPAAAPEALAFFLDFYRQHKLDTTVPYPGVSGQLERLQRMLAVPMAVLTNKPVRASEQICEGLDLARFFFRIYGGNSFATKKPDPEGLQALMAESSASAAETLLIGDSDVDLRTAAAAGCWSIGCLYGLSPQTIEASAGTGAVDATVDLASEWCEALGLAAAASAGATDGL